MEQTGSLSDPVLKAFGLAPAVVLASATLVASPISAESMLVTRGVLIMPTVSRPERLMGEARSWNEIKAARIREFRGKYRNALTPSEEFARRKLLEISLEG